ncbi:polysaccharide deacetylase family protein [Cohnella hongkongensis]|uniref:Polysaccharide deacetylase family protein n=1 Tax=Cohnella hongkongensis TaxID=178337 RepID=A0ABV9FBH2_9BACL
MARKIPVGLLAAMTASLAAVLLAGTYGPIRPFVQTVKLQETSITALTEDKREDELLSWIRSEAPKRSQPPINAVIDRVWKAIPGYDGRVVDIKATYLKAKLLGSTASSGDSFPWVYKTVKPKVSLQDLPVQPIYRGNAAKPAVGLMINVAWGDEYLPAILDVLKEQNVKATFFFDGTWLSKNRETARKIIEQGHEASNHAYTHPDMSKLGAERQRQEIGRTEQLLKQLGVNNVWFAPPSGYYNENTIKVAAEYGLRTVLWTLDTIDWQKPDPSSVVLKVSRKVGPGALILMHPTSTTAGALEGMIAAIKTRGYFPGTVSETLSPERIDVRL